VGTTKLTRKEILAEDPVHGSMVMLANYFSTHKKIIILVAAVVIVLILGIYGGSIFLEKRGNHAQEILARGMDYYHAEVDPEATDDPYQNGSVAVFKTDDLKYQAAINELGSIVSGYGYSGVSPIARYYLGLTKLKMGKTEEGIEDLEIVSSNSKERNISHLAKKVLAREYAKNGNYDEAKKILEVMIQDAAYELPLEDLRIQLAGILNNEGKYEEALTVLQEGASEGSSLSPLRQRLMTELEKVQKESQLHP